MLQTLWADFLTLIFPESCLACGEPLGKQEHLVCLSCQLAMPQTQFHLQPTDNPLAKRFWGKVPLQHAFAYYRFSKHSRIQRLLHQLKYRNQPEIGELLGYWYGLQLARDGFTEHFDMIIPVPLHPAKQRKRGYNQADYIAAGISKGLGVPALPTALTRLVNTQTQTRKHRFERYENVKGVFATHNANLLRGQRILIVDDVITTGSTLETCAALVLDCGCESVSVASLATG